MEQIPSNSLKTWKTNLKTKFNNIDSNFFKKIFRNLFLLIIASLLLTVGFNYFIHSGGFFNGGFTGITQTIVYSIFSNEDQKKWYYLIYILLNVPFIIFGFFKVGKFFTFYTLFFILMQNVWNYIFSIIPILKNLEIMPQLLNSGIPVVSSFIYAFVGSIIWGTSLGLAFYAGGSSGGTDFLAAYLAIWKKQSVAKFQKYMNYIIIIIAIFVKYFTEHYEENLLYALFKSHILYSSMIFATISAFVLDLIYPKFKIVSVIIITKLPLEVAEHFKNNEYPNDATLIGSSDIKSGVVSGTIIATMSLIEYKKVKYNVHKVDPTAFLIVVPVKYLAGKFKIQRFI